MSQNSFHAIHIGIMENENDSKDTTIDLILGVCIKDAKGNVLSQNKKCNDFCGMHVGEICQYGCMKNVPLQIDAGSIVEFPITIHNVFDSAEFCDAVVIKTEKNIVTILYSRQREIEKELLMFAGFGLSKMEQMVVLLVLDGHSNIEIADKLFISFSTVKTHINNLYKKLPHSLKQKIISLRK